MPLNNYMNNRLQKAIDIFRNFGEDYQCPFNSWISQDCVIKSIHVNGFDEFSIIDDILIPLYVQFASAIEEFIIIQSDDGNKEFNLEQDVKSFITDLRVEDLL